MLTDPPFGARAAAGALTINADPLFRGTRTFCLTALPRAPQSLAMRQLKDENR